MRDPGKQPKRLFSMYMEVEQFDFLVRKSEEMQRSIAYLIRELIEQSRVQEEGESKL